MSVSLREENKMAVRPVFPLLMSMAIPPMISMLIQSLYNIVDSMFVAKIGEDALTAVSLAFPVQTLIVACSVGIGVGVNSYISRSLGREERAGGRQCSGTWSAHGGLCVGPLCPGRSVPAGAILPDVQQ